MSIDENSNEFNNNGRPSKGRKTPRQSGEKSALQKRPPMRSKRCRRPWSEQAAQRKARTAFHNAKYRCGRLPGYENTRLLFKTANELISAIGLPSSAQQSLDRIDPYGHYEPTNVRWANKHVQAVNKRGRRDACLPSIDQLVEDAKASQLSCEHRKLTSELWISVISEIARAECSFDREQLSKALGNLAIPSDSFDAYDIPRHDLPPGVFHLPALTYPNSVVRVRGGPFGAHLSPKEGDMHVRQRRSRWAKRGIVGLFVGDHFRANFLKSELDDLRTDLPGPGACWIGSPSPQALLGGWFEGKMVSAAGRLTELGHYAAVLPACCAIEDLEKYEATEYDKRLTAIDADFLFIPDFQVDQGKTWSTDPRSLFVLTRLLEMRREARRKTFFGVQSLRKMSSTVRTYILGRFSVREFEAQDQVSHPSAKQVRASALATYRQLTGRRFPPRYYDLD